MVMNIGYILSPIDFIRPIDLIYMYDSLDIYLPGSWSTRQGSVMVMPLSTSRVTGLLMMVGTKLACG